MVIPRQAGLTVKVLSPEKSGELWGHPLKGPCQEEKFILCEKIYFLAKFQLPATSISTFAEISLGFRLQSSLHQSPIRIKVMSR
jgi:hypothetical protein